jgi:hypothetical protein
MRSWPLLARTVPYQGRSLAAGLLFEPEMADEHSIIFMYDQDGAAWFLTGLFTDHTEGGECD